MARCTFQPGSALSGSIAPPPSHAHALRLVWGACLGAGGAIGNCPNTPSIRALLELGNQLGADAVWQDGTADIFGPGFPYMSEQLSCGGNSYAARFGLPLAALSGSPVTIDDVQLPPAASQWLDGAAKAVDLRLTRTAAQISIQGPPSADGLALTDRAGAFWAPGWMMALPLCDESIILEMDDFTRLHPAVTMTLAVLDQFGIRHAQDDSSAGLRLSFSPQQQYPPRYIDVEADWRTGSYFLAALLLAGGGEVALSSFSSQPERAFWKPFEETGLLRWSEDGLVAKVSGHHLADLPPELDPRPCPSLLPLMMVLATQSTRPVRIGPLSPVSPRTLMRAKLMEEALALLGADVRVGELWTDAEPSKLMGGTVDCGNDARVAMALGLAGLIASAPLVIENAQAVSDVHAAYWADLRRLGAQAQMAFTSSRQSPPSAGQEKEQQNISSGQEDSASPAPSVPLTNEDWHSV